MRKDYKGYQGPEDMEEDFLFCRPLQTTTTGEDIFMKVDSFLKEEGLLWRQCYSVCCDGAPALLGARQGFTAQVKQENPSVMIVHCLRHHENLASQKLSRELQKVMQEVTQVVNFIKARALNSRLFSLKCALILVLSIYICCTTLRLRGNVLQRLLELRTETDIIDRKESSTGPQILRFKMVDASSLSCRYVC